MNIKQEPVEIDVFKCSFWCKCYLQNWRKQI